MCYSRKMLWIFYSIILTLANQTSSQILLMAQSWATTHCLLILHEGYPCSATSESWTMHGIWLPGVVEGRTVHCNVTWPLDKEEIKPIEPELDRFWRGINDTESGHYDFWSHEWTKHGTCVATTEVTEPLNSQIKYFTQGLKWIKQYAITSALNEASILPSNEVEYNITDIFKAVLSKFKIKPLIRCATLEGSQFVSDVILCFNSTLHLSDCEIENSLRERYNQTYVEGTSVLASCDFGKGVLYLRNNVEDLGYFLNTSKNIESTASEP